MKKITTLFKKDPENLGLVINEINPENEWALKYGKPSRKWDGTACAIIKDELYKRYDSKINKKTGKRKPLPEGAIPCQEPDVITGHWPHWVKCDRNNPGDKYHFEAFDRFLEDDGYDCEGTYELCGEKIQGNPEKIRGHVLIAHGTQSLKGQFETSFDGIKEYLSDPKNDIEGIVFDHFWDDRMCKIRKSDFGIKR